MTAKPNPDLLRLVRARLVAELDGIKGHEQVKDRDPAWKFLHEAGDADTLRESKRLAEKTEGQVSTYSVDRKNMTPWPDDLPIPLAIGTALNAIERDLDDMALWLASNIEAVASIVIPNTKARNAALARSLVAEQWPLPRESTLLMRAEPVNWAAQLGIGVDPEAIERTKRRHRAAQTWLRAMPGRSGWCAFVVIRGFFALVRRVLKGEPARLGEGWPVDAGRPRAVAEWSAPALEKALPEIEVRDLLDLSAMLVLDSNHITHEIDTFGDDAGAHLWIPFAGLALLYTAEQNVERDRTRPFIALDTGRAHSELLGGLARGPRRPNQTQEVQTSGGCIELFDPTGGNSVQLTLDLPDTSDQEAIIRAIKRVRGPEGLRHWLGLQRLFSVEGGRQGYVRWTVDDHLAALGYTPGEIRRPATRDKAADLVNAFTRLILRGYASDRRTRLWADAPLIHVGKRYGRVKGSKHELDGMELRINDLLYTGVRQPNGRLGSNWYPTCTDLPKLDHQNHIHALTLGAILPQRFRLAWRSNRRPFIEYTGRVFLELAGIAYQPTQPGRMWGQLEKALDKLRDIEGLGVWEWTGAPRTDGGLLKLTAPQWAVDRTIGGVRPVELPPGPPVLTGDELRDWRNGLGLSQAAAAELLGVSRTTVARAELAGDDRLTSNLADRVRQVRAS